MREQNNNIALFTEEFILRDNFLGFLEGNAPQVVGMGVRKSHQVNLNNTYDPDFDALDIEYLIGYGANASAVGGMDVGTDVAEVRQSDGLWQ